MAVAYLSQLEDRVWSPPSSPAKLVDGILERNTRERDQLREEKTLGKIEAERRKLGGEKESKKKNKTFLSYWELIKKKKPLVEDLSNGKQLGLFWCFWIFGFTLWENLFFPPKKIITFFFLKLELAPWLAPSAWRHGSSFCCRDLLSFKNFTTREMNGLWCPFIFPLALWGHWFSYKLCFPNFSWILKPGLFCRSEKRIFIFVCVMVWGFGWIVMCFPVLHVLENTLKKLEVVFCDGSLEDYNSY